MATPKLYTNTGDKWAAVVLYVDDGTGNMVPAGGANLVVPVTIPNGTALSNQIDLGNARLGAIQMPAAWTAADITFAVSADGVTYGPYFNLGTEYDIAGPAASQYLGNLLADFLDIRFVQVRSGTSASPVNQGGARVLQLVLVP